MNLLSLRIFHEVLTIVLLLCFTCAAQPSQHVTAEQELGLEVDRGISQPLELRVVKGGGAGIASFRRIKSWRPSAGEAPVNDILFKFDREADSVIAEISVSLENEKEVKIGTYRLALSETITIEELTKFGVEPLVLKVVRAKPLIKPVAPLMPILDNKTKAVEVVSFNKADPPLESFFLILRNVSRKSITAVDLFIPAPNGNGGQGQQAGGYKTNPVMLPEAVSSHHINVSSGGQMTPTGFVPEPAYQRTLIIRTVVFDDGTYDGMVEPAAEIAAENKGTNIQRRRILRLLEEQGKPGGTLQSRDALKESIYALSITAEESVVDELLTYFPSLDHTPKPLFLDKVGWGLKLGKQEFLHLINQVEETQKQSGEQLTFNKWLKQMRVAYEELISR